MSEFISTRLPNRPVQPAPRQAGRKGREETTERSVYAPPPQPFQVIPTPAVLQQLVKRALDALANGFYWDRGSIINLVL